MKLNHSRIMNDDIHAYKKIRSSVRDAKRFSGAPLSDNPIAVPSIMAKAVARVFVAREVYLKEHLGDTKDNPQNTSFNNLVKKQFIETINTNRVFYVLLKRLEEGSCLR